MHNDVITCRILRPLWRIYKLKNYLKIKSVIWTCTAEKVCTFLFLHIEYTLHIECKTIFIIPSLVITRVQTLFSQHNNPTFSLLHTVFKPIIIPSISQTTKMEFRKKKNALIKTYITLSDEIQTCDQLNPGNL
jgi:hypothetical protein